MSEKKIFRFSVESAILRELGEQLVSKPEVALTELIKNSYDADSPECEVHWNKKRIIVKDLGHGMTLEEFKSRWMRIATGNKGIRSHSSKYARKLTGSKGIGRFAVRFLGHRLLLITTAKNPETDTNETLVAFFNWKRLDETTDIENLEIRYRYYPNVSAPTGTKLIISDLRYTPNDSLIKNVRSNALKMVSPFKALLGKIEDDAPKEIIKYISKDSSSQDPGFNLSFHSALLDDSNHNTETPQNELSRLVLDLAVSRIKFYTKKNHRSESAILKIVLHHELAGICFEKELEIDNIMGCNVYGDISYFPDRAGVFLNKPVDGNIARGWVKDNSSVSVFDKGFRVVPYGQKGDDWLNLDEDSSRNARHWRTEFMEQLFPMTSEERADPGVNPMLAIPVTHQLVGAIFVDAANTRVTNNSEALSPTMDRQGFLENNGFNQLKKIARFSIELIAKFDRKLRLEELLKKRERDFENAWDDIDKTIKVIEKVPSLSFEDKERLTKQYTQLRQDFVVLSEHDQKSRESLVAMGLLGVVAGFMTHEYQSTLHELQEAQARIEYLSTAHPELKSHAEKIAESIANFNGYIDYTQAFITNIHSQTNNKFNVLPQIRNVLSTFSKYRSNRGIEVDISSIADNLSGPNIPVTMYKGILHNLYSNALKALADFKSDKKIIKIEAFNTNKRHVIRVIDNGPGIPPGMRKLIWDPLFTTTSTENNPLGSGMGLGLSLVRRLVEMKNGKISLEKAQEGFSTCFEVQLILDGENK